MKLALRLDGIKQNQKSKLKLKKLILQKIKKQKSKMKNIIRIILAVVLTTHFGFGNNSSYKLTLTNLNLTSPKTLEFDIYLLNTASKQEELRYSLGQYFFEFNPKIANGGNLIISIAASDLPESMRPRNPSAAGNIIRLIVNAVSPDKNNLPVILDQKPGMLIARVKLETSADKFAAGEPLNLSWTSPENKMQTKIIAFNGKENYEITNAENHFSELDHTENGVTDNMTEKPTEYSLSQNYPNPFNPTTNIKFDIPLNGSDVKLIVYDLTGRALATLVNERLNAGSYHVTFNGANLASGMYFYKITAGEFSVVRKMVLIK
jgi:Secretion system C-terminal sorting domain